MRKKRRTEEHDNADRWVVSYADFITLLFAFFTTLYAISHVDLGKLERFSGSMKTAFKAAKTDSLGTPVVNGLKPPDYADVAFEKEVRSAFAESAILEGIAVSRDQRGVIVSLGDELLFESGTAELRQEGRPLLAAAAALIKRSGRSVIIEGHTDNIPLRSQRFSTNMELSAARAARAFEWLLNEEAVSPDRMSVAGYGEYRPVASNADPEGRARNRRIDILFVSPKD